ncbi:LysM peptidoglycan-binding domain-containing protein [Pseudarthrobacter sp. NS4]|uniref:LysM peptidoglycan-binding domain-containing protein n=1 Tax=Pseudarthrobacter sp. NS4 TaxID=2973976 RepID=UPI002163DACB|nr:hypothetical protein [Pseudarthrobacter sp. NS4]
MANNGESGIRTDAIVAGGLLLLGFLLSLIGAGLVGQWQNTAARNQTFRVEDLLGAAAATAGAGLLLWWIISLMCAAAGLLLEKHGNARAAAVTRRMSPAFMRRLVVAAVSVQLLSGPAAQAAGPVPGPQWSPTGGQETSAPAATGNEPAVPATQEHETSEPDNPIMEASSPEGLNGGALELTPVTGDPLEQIPADHASRLEPAPVDGLPVSDKLPAARPAPRSTIHPGWQPSAPVVEPGLLAAPPVRSQSSLHQETGRQPGFVAVLAGDSLWDIVAHHLGPQASDVDIALEWPRWYEANKALIGQNPDVLLPGQVLLPPPTA